MPVCLRTVVATAPLALICEGAAARLDNDGWMVMPGDACSGVSPVPYASTKIFAQYAGARSAR